MKNNFVKILLIAFFPLVGLEAIDHNTESSQQEEAVYVTPDLLQWAETVYPGTEITKVFGNPSKPGQIYAIRLKLPANYVVRPHTHTQDEFMTVISGSLHVGIG